MNQLLSLSVGLFALQVLSAQITPESACGPNYHEFSPRPPYPAHAPRTTSLDSILSSDIVVEGVVITKRSYAGSGVQDDIEFRVSKVLKGSPSLVGGVIKVSVRGGYAPDDRDGNLCLRDEISDGIRVEVGSSYVLPLTKEIDGDVYRAEDLGGWFRISNEGELVSLTPSLTNNKLLPVLKIFDLEKRAERMRRPWM